MRTSVRRAMAWFAALSLALPLAACSGEGEQGEPRKNVALIVRMKHGDYWKTVKQGAESAAREFDLNLNFYAPDYEEDVNGQIRLFEQALQDGVDAVVLAPSDDAALSEQIERAARMNVPVIAIDSEANAPGVRSYIGTDHYDSGRKAGEKLVQLVGPAGRIAILSFANQSRSNRQREQGLLDALARHPQVQVVARQYGYADRKLVGDLAQKLIAGHAGIDGVAALDATAAVSIAKKLEESGLAGKVKVVAIDSPLEVLGYIQEGVIQATISHQPFTMGYLGVRHAADALNGTAIPERVDTETKVIDLENMFWSEHQKLLFPFAN